MFDAYSSPAHQSAVERLIQLATGKKNPARAEGEPASQEAAAPSPEAAPESSTEKMQAATEPSSMPAETETVPETADAEEQMESHETEATPVEDISVNAVGELQASGEAEPSLEAETDRRIKEHAQEAATGPEASAEPEQRSDDIAEQAPEFAHTRESSFEPVAVPILLGEGTAVEVQAESQVAADAEAFEAQEKVAPEDSGEPSREGSAEGFLQHLDARPLGHFGGYSFEHHDDHAFHEEPVESALVESILAEYEAEHADEPEHALEQGSHFASSALHDAIEKQQFHENQPEPPAEAALADEPIDILNAGPALEEEQSSESTPEPAPAADSPVEETIPEHEENAQQEVEAGVVAGSEVATPEAATENHEDTIAPIDGEEGEEPIKLEKYLRSSTDRNADANSPDVVPSSHDTTYLKSKDMSEPPNEEELKELARDPMWKTLMQFKGWLPLVTRVLPLLEMAGNRAGQSSSVVSGEVKDAIQGLQVSNRDLRLTMQDQTLELKRVEEQVARLRDAADKTAFEQQATADEVKSLHRLLRNAFLYVGILLGLLVVAVGYMAFLVFTYLNHPIQ